MGISILKNNALVLSGLNFSSVVTRCELVFNAELVDETAMGDSTRTRIAGLKDWTVTADLHNDWKALSTLSHALWAFVGGSSFNVAVYPSGTAVGVANPRFSGAGILQDMVPVGAGVGEMDATRITILAAGDLAKSTS